MFYFYLPRWFSCYSLASAKLWLAKRSSCPAIISYSWAATRLASMTASLICWAFSLKCFSKQEKKKNFSFFQHTIIFIWRFTKLVPYNDLFSWSSQYSKSHIKQLSNAWKITSSSNEAIGLQQSFRCTSSSIHFLSSLPYLLWWFY